jgi:hypothetical protein
MHFRRLFVVFCATMPGMCTQPRECLGMRYVEANALLDILKA